MLCDAMAASISPIRPKKITWEHTHAFSSMSLSAMSVSPSSSVVTLIICGMVSKNIEMAIDSLTCFTLVACTACPSMPNILSADKALGKTVMPAPFVSGVSACS